MQNLSERKVSYMLHMGIIKPLMNPATNKPISARELSIVFGTANCQVQSENDKECSYKTLKSIGNLTVKTTIGYPDMLLFKLNAPEIARPSERKALQDLAATCFKNIGFKNIINDIYEWNGVIATIDVDYDSNNKDYNIQAANTKDLKSLFDLISNVRVKFKTGYIKPDTKKGKYKTVPISTEKHMNRLRSYMEQNQK